LVYAVDCFTDTRLKVEAEIGSGRADRAGSVDVLLGDSVVWRWPAGSDDVGGRLTADVSLDRYDGESHELTIRCAGNDLELRITTLELSFHKELPDAAKAALVDPVSHRPLRYSRGRHDPPAGFVCSQDGSLRFSDRRLFDGGKPVSLHPYPPMAMDVIARHRDGLVLDYGAGLPSFHFRDVITADVVDAPGVDVVLDDGRLPFADGTFSAVLSLAVLEHVRDPFEYGAEVLRVLRDDGELYVDTAFIQHYHGWPHHYFNFTQMGLREVFSGRVHELEYGVQPYQSATLALIAVIADWLVALPGHLRAEAEAMPLRDFIAELRGNPYRNRLSSALGPEADRLISAGVYLHARKLPVIQVIPPQPGT
jgi:SAM-dependent methyltransferase